MCQCLLIKIVTSNDVPQSSLRLFLVAFKKKAVTLQIFMQQLATLATHHIPAQKNCLTQQKTAHNHTFLHEVRVIT